MNAMFLQGIGVFKLAAISQGVSEVTLPASKCTISVPNLTHAKVSIKKIDKMVSEKSQICRNL